MSVKLLLVKSQMKKTVNDTFDELKKSVEEEISKQVAAIDHKELQKDVREAAKQKILDKFDDNLDDILKDFNDNLSKVKKIYTGISDILQHNPDNGKEIRFKVG